MCLSKDGRSFKDKMAPYLLYKKQIKGKVSIDLILNWNNKRKRDLDNYFKAIIDSIKNKLIEDDDSITKLHAVKRCGTTLPPSSPLPKLSGFDLVVESIPSTLEGVAQPSLSNTIAGILQTSSGTNSCHLVCNLTIPSNNTYYRNFRGHMCLSPKGRQFKEMMQAYFEGKEQVVGPVCVYLVVNFKDRRIRDLDNYFKAVFDAIKGYLIEDDYQVVELWAEKNITVGQNNFELLILRAIEGTH